MDAASAEVRDDYLPSVGAVGALQSLAQKVRIAESHAVIATETTNPGSVEPDLQATLAAYAKARSGYERLIDPGEERERFGRIDALWTTHLARHEMLLDLLRQGSRAPASALYKGEMDAIFRDLTVLLDEDVKYNDDHGQAAADRAVARYRATRVTALTIIAATTLMTLAIGFGLARTISTPLAGMTEAMRRLATGMIAVRIGPDLRSAVVGSPRYFAIRPMPKKPQDLTAHVGINLRLPTHGGLYAWEFERGGRELKVRVDGQVVFNSSPQLLDAALAGFGLAYLPEDVVADHVAQGRLIRVLADWCPPYPGYHLYYPSRRQPTSAFAVLVNALHYRG